MPQPGLPLPAALLIVSAVVILAYVLHRTWKSDPERIQRVVWRPIFSFLLSSEAP